MPNETTERDRCVDFHLVVNKVAGAEDLGFVVVTAKAPVSHWGYRFDRLGGGKSLVELLERSTGIAPLVDAGGKLRLRWPEPAPAGTTQNSRQVGQVLFDALFPEGSEVYELLGRSCDVANRAGQVLRLKLELHPDLSNLPWEAMRWPLTGSWARDLGQAKISVLRYMGDINHKWPEPAGSPGTRPCVLLVKADPSELSDRDIALSFFGERNRVERVLNDPTKPSSVDVEVIEKLQDRKRHSWPGTLQKLIECTDARLEDQQPIIGLHFIGHGGVDSAGGFLYGEDAEGHPERIGEDELRLALDRVDTLR
jgi:hypothetical protein